MVKGAVCQNTSRFQGLNNSVADRIIDGAQQSFRNVSKYSKNMPDHAAFIIPTKTKAKHSFYQYKIFWKPGTFNNELYLID